METRWERDAETSVIESGNILEAVKEIDCFKLQDSVVWHRPVSIGNKNW